jgi:hypothetical protein
MCDVRSLFPYFINVFVIYIVHPIHSTCVVRSRCLLTLYIFLWYIHSYHCHSARVVCVCVCVCVCDMRSLCTCFPELM